MDKKFATDHDLSRAVTVQLDSRVFHTTPRFAERYGKKTYEAATLAYLLRRLKPGDIFIDVGAHHGYFSLKASAEVGKAGQVIAIEPDPDNFALLTKNAAQSLGGNIQTLHAGLSNKKGRAQFKISAASDNSSFHKHPNADVLKTITIEVETIDSICADSNRQAIRLIKIDTEGHEIEVIQGATQTIRKNPSLELIVEFNPKCLTAAGHEEEELFDLLDSLGFKMFILDDFDTGRLLRGDRKRIKAYVQKHGRANVLCAHIDNFSEALFLVRQNVMQRIKGQ